MAMNYNSQDDSYKVLGTNLNIASKIAGDGITVAKGSATLLFSGMGWFLIGLVILLLLLDSGFSSDILINKDIEKTYDNVMDAMKPEYDKEVKKGYDMLVTKINSTYGAEYGCAININDYSQAFIPDTHENDTFFGDEHGNKVEKGFIKYSNDKCNVNIELDIYPSLKDLSKITTVYYSATNAQLGKVDYSILTGHARPPYTTREESTRYESVEADDFYRELRETDYTLSSPKNLEQLGYDSIKIEVYNYKIEVKPEVTCDGEEEMVEDEYGTLVPACVPSPAEYEYEDHIFIGNVTPPEPSGNIVEITHKSSLGGEGYNIKDVVYLDIYQIRQEEIENLINYEVDHSDISYGDSRSNFEELLSFRFMNMIQVLALEDEYRKVAFSNPYGDYTDLFLVDGFYYPDIIEGDISLLLEMFGLSSYDDLIQEIQRLQKDGLIQNNTKDIYLQCTEFVSYMTYKLYGSNLYPGCDGGRGASELQSLGWSGSFADVGAGSVLSRPAYDGTRWGHTMICIGRDGDNITIADANRNHRGGISVYTVDINELNDSVGGRLQVATKP